MRRGRCGLSELLSALILLSISVAVAFIMVYYLPVVSPPSVRPWLRPTLIAAFSSSGAAEIYLYNPHSDHIIVLEAWVGGNHLKCPDGAGCSCFNENGQKDPECRIEPRTYEVVRVSGSAQSILLRFDTGAWMEVRLG
ncbi:MAG: hypothetical protein QXG35_02925 [Nitrososphaerota archaeon]